MIRKAKLNDVPQIRELINSHAERERMLFRSLSDLYENIRDFFVCEVDNKVVGCGGLQTIWADLAELKSLAVHNDYQGRGIGKQLVQAILTEARELGLPKVFTLTLEETFFLKTGFKTVSMDTLPMKVWSECIRCPKQAHCDEIAMTYELV